MRIEKPPQQSPQTDNHYRTQSLYEGSYLLAKGFSLAGKEGIGNKITILFKDDPKIRDESLSFYNGAKIEAKRYSDCYRTLKDFVFER